MARRKKALTGNCGGCKTLAEARPEAVALARQLHDQGMSYRKISAALAERGHVTGGGKPYAPGAVQTMLALHPPLHRSLLPKSLDLPRRAVWLIKFLAQYANVVLRASGRQPALHV